MLKQLKKIIKKALRKPVQDYQPVNPDKDQRPVDGKLEKNVNYLRSFFAKCSDIIVREFEAGTSPPVKAIIAYVDGLVNKEMLTTDLLKSFMYQASQLNSGSTMVDAAAFARKAVPFTEVKVQETMYNGPNFMAGLKGHDFPPALVGHADPASDAGI